MARLTIGSTYFVVAEQGSVRINSVIREMKHKY